MRNKIWLAVAVAFVMAAPGDAFALSALCTEKDRLVKKFTSATASFESARKKYCDALYDQKNAKILCKVVSDHMQTNLALYGFIEDNLEKLIAEPNCLKQQSLAVWDENFEKVIRQAKQSQALLKMSGCPAGN